MSLPPIYLLPVSAIIGGKRLLKNNPFDRRPAGVYLNFDRNTAIKDKLSKKAVTDSPCDADDAE